MGQHYLTSLEVTSIAPPTSSSIDNVLGETVNYTCDYLHRLTAATATNGSWGESYGYDGFGNLMSKTPTQGSAPAYQNPLTQPNATGGALTGGTWDVESRLTVSGYGGTSGASYVYDPWGRRVWTQFYDNSYGTSFEAYFYGATGQKLESYNCTIPANGELSCALEGTNTYFAGRMISEKGVYVVTDRLGSVRGDSTATNFAYFPWGEERGTTAHTGRTLFAGYYRDAVGQDYAMARYYNAGTGAFWSQDPGSISTADSSNPTSWNRYAYATADPVNLGDPTGKIVQWTGDNCGSDWMWDSSLSGPCCDPSQDGFLGAAPDPACYAGGGDGPSETSSSSTSAPTCDIEFGYAPALSAKIPGKHTFFDVEDSSGTWNVVDAGPTNNPPFKVISQPPVTIGPIHIPRPPKIQWIGYGNLHTNVSASGLYNEATNPNTVVTFNNVEPCSLVTTLEQEAKSLNNSVAYTAVGIGSGWYNSNSFTYTLVTDLGLPISGPNVYAPGWGNYIPH